MEKESSMDLSTKYHKLATEFAKIRAQGNVLKKAVLEEQAKNVKLKDEVQVKDQSLRKLEQEMDSISFRNTQLEKRVGFLQDELTNLTNAGKGKKLAKKKEKEGVPAGAVAIPGETGIFDYELLSKIEENIQLHKQISDLEENFRREVTSLKIQIEEKEFAEQRQKQETSSRLESENSEKLSLTHSLQSALDENDAYRDQVVQLQEKIRTLSVLSNSNNTASSTHSQSNSFAGGHIPDGWTGAAFPKQGSLDSGQEDLNSTDIFDRLIKSEQSKEHWLIEYQLYKMKYSKILKKLEEAKAILKELGKGNLLNDDTTPSTEASQSHFFTSMIGKMEVTTTEDPEERSLCEEREVNAYLLSRINELISLAQLANSKAITYYSECVSMESLLALHVQKRLDIEEKCSGAIEELQVTKQNYESQLGTMTEHIANLNDTMLAQKETIEELTYALSNKASKSKK